MRDLIAKIRARLSGVSFTSRYVLLVGVLLLMTNILLGVVAFNQSKSAMKTLINKNMLDLVGSAADSLDGDALEALTEDDVDGPAFNEAKDRLTVFQNNADITYIYAVKQDGPDRFVFTVDADPEEPAAFGEETVVTPALVSAAQGAPAVDQDTAEDRWGNLYSAYCPVYNSSDEIVGIVGVDFDSAWYDAQLRSLSISIAIVTAISLLVGIALVTQMTHRVRLRFRDLDEGISGLSDNVDVLMSEMASYSGFDLPEAEAASQAGGVDAQEVGTDELDALSNKIHEMQSGMSMYLDYLHTQAYTDALTKVNNTSAYHEAVQAIEDQIAAGTANFWVAIFDINSLKQLNDNYGHECGDYYIQESARAIAHVFGEERTYRIGGDEFAVITEDLTQAQMTARLDMVTAGLAVFNTSDKPYPAELSLSQGASQYDSEKDASFRDVFARADHIMYGNKRLFYQTKGVHINRTA